MVAMNAQMASVNVIEREVDHEEWVEYAQYVLRSGDNLCTWGEPGIGKTVLNKLLPVTLKKVTGKNYYHVDMRSVDKDPTDIKGMPDVVEIPGRGRRTDWILPMWLPDQNQDELMVVTFEELNRAAELTQNSVLEILNERTVGPNYKLPEGTMMTAACNYEKDGGGIRKMTAALADRFNHCYLSVKAAAWLRWAEANDIHQYVLKFIEFRPALLQAFDPKAKACPTCRSWEKISNLLKLNPPDSQLYRLVQGRVGDAVAIEFVQFVQIIKHVPDVQSIFDTPKKAKVPKEPSACYAVANALARLATLKNFDAIVAYVVRLEDEYNVLCIKTCVEMHRELAHTPAYSAWEAEHGKKLIHQ